MKEVLDSIKSFTDKAEEARDKYEPAVKMGLEAVESAKGLLEAMQSGDTEAVQKQLTRWQDVNETLAAVQDMDRAIEEATSGPEIGEILGVVMKVMKVAVTLASAA